MDWIKVILTVGSDTVEVQRVAETLAAICIGNRQLESSLAGSTVTALRQVLNAIPTHYLYLRDADDLSSFFGCGSAHGAADAMITDGSICRLYSIPVEECPNCREEEEE